MLYVISAPTINQGLLYMEYLHYLIIQRKVIYENGQDKPKINCTSEQWYIFMGCQYITEHYAPCIYI